MTRQAGGEILRLHGFILSAVEGLRLRMTFAALFCCKLNRYRSTGQLDYGARLRFLLQPPTADIQFERLERLGAHNFYITMRAGDNPPLSFEAIDFQRA